ncbi:hypothetical protein EK21DRAFT_94853 [Setomelanomma holmii]|uniref:NADH dehydrogenase subunit 6 n=1 Tax=Setomelanomma holmii TaxID=210430 RepID=A0A9P4LFT2_9PLEO|nr:hypothetical protein EK21DRAFT_94853 [Setomelanomma holmii]
MPRCLLLLPALLACLACLACSALKHLVHDSPAVRAGRLSQLIQLCTYYLLLYGLYGLLVLPRSAPAALLLLAVVAGSHFYCCLFCLKLRAGQLLAIHILAHNPSPAACSAYEGLHSLAVIHRLL